MGAQPIQQAAQQLANNLTATKTPARAAVSASSPAAKAPRSSLEAALRASLELPADAPLPAQPLTAADVVLTDQDRARLLELLEPWARHVRAQELNSALLREQMAVQAANGPRPWLSADQIFDAVQVVGAQMYPGFVVDKYLYPVLAQLSYYFAQDPQFEKMGDEEELDLKKGLLVFGPVGCGKSILFKILAQIDRRFSFRITHCDELAETFAAHGVGSLEPYYRQGGRLYLDDLGTENARVQNFGFKCNPLADVLTRRERLEPRPRTFASTNCDAATLERIYEERACSRMVAMFNFISFDPETPDRRQVRPVQMTQADVDQFSYLFS